MKEWLESEIEKCKREMQHAAEMHFMTKWTAQAALEATQPPQELEGLREAIGRAFYEAEKHVPAKGGHCDKCGFCHCEVGHVLAMAQEGVEAALTRGAVSGG